MPERSEKVERLNEKAGQYELPYISKSRVMQWIKNPEHFRLKYLEGIEEPETFAMRRGTNIHETFEHIYREAEEAGWRPGDELAPVLPDDRELWADFIEPHVSNFIKWEGERWARAEEEPAAYLPRSVEEEHWREDVIPHEDAPAWMGIADAVLPADGVPGVPRSEGVVIVDFKTGSVPSEKYRNKGILTELAYYALLFGDKYDVVATAAYYPKEDELLVQPEWTDAADDRAVDVMEAVAEMSEAVAEYEGDTKFETNEGPLCGWGEDEDQRSSFYGVCSQCTWNVPVDRKNEFIQLVEEGYSDREIAEHFGCTPNSCSYWRYKLT